jgi:hypothetical protein
MSTHIKHENGEIYFLTFTCFKWLPLIQESNSYHSFNHFFGHLKEIMVPLLGYVIMPNHFHGLLFVPQESRKPLDKIVSGGKRFLAYEIVKNLKDESKLDLLNVLRSGVQEKERKKGKKHQVFRLSYDGKECSDIREVEKCLDYIHHNPVSGKWNLAPSFLEYPHSSALFYEQEQENEYLTHYKEITG